MHISNVIAQIASYYSFDCQMFCECFILGVKHSCAIAILVLDYSQLPPMAVIEMTSGGNGDHICFQWVTQEASDQGMSDCFTRASSRTYLYTEPAPWIPEYKRGMIVC